MTAIRAEAGTVERRSPSAPMLLALALAYGFSPLSIDMYLSAFPRMARDLYVSASASS